jgi:hypothetical protein
MNYIHFLPAVRQLQAQAFFNAFEAHQAFMRTFNVQNLGVVNIVLAQYLSGPKTSPTLSSIFWSQRYKGGKRP